MSKIKLSDIPIYSTAEYIRCFPDISVSELDEILDWLADYGFLSVSGLDFKTLFWSTYIKDWDVIKKKKQQ